MKKKEKNLIKNKKTRSWHLACIVKKCYQFKHRQWKGTNWAKFHENENLIEHKRKWGPNWIKTTKIGTKCIFKPTF